MENRLDQVLRYVAAAALIVACALLPLLIG